MPFKAICPLERHGELLYFRIINPDIFVNQTLIHPYTYFLTSNKGKNKLMSIKRLSLSPSPRHPLKPLQETGIYLKEDEITHAGNS
jgi:hypothetical protein